MVLGISVGRSLVHIHAVERELRARERRANLLGIVLGHRDAVAVAARAGGGVFDDPCVIVDRRAARHPREFGGVGKRNLITGVSARNDLVLDLEVLTVGHGERKPRLRTGGTFDLFHLRRVLFLGQLRPLPAASLIDLERRRHQRALGVHGVDELEEVARTQQVDSRLVDLDGVLDTVAVAQLLAGLFDDVVLDGDGAATGFELLTSRLGLGGVGELHLVRGGVVLAALDRRLERELRIAGICAELIRGNGEGNRVAVATHIAGGKLLVRDNRLALVSAPIPLMQIVGVLHERVLCGARDIAHTVRKGIDDVQRCAAKLSSSVIFSCRALLAIRVHRPVDDPCTLFVRAVNGAPVETLVPRHLRLGFRLLDRGRRFLVDNVHDEVGVLPLKVQTIRADRRKVRVPARQCI